MGTGTKFSEGSKKPMTLLLARGEPRPCWKTQGSLEGTHGKGQEGSALGTSQREQEGPSLGQGSAMNHGQQQWRPLLQDVLWRDRRQGERGGDTPSSYFHTPV